MSEEIRPVRAWAEYDEWSMFIEREKNSFRWQWVPFAIPKTGAGTYSFLIARDSLVEVFSQPADGRPRFDFGPLRSLRVLLSNGCEIRLDREAAYGVVMLPKPGWCFLSEHGQNEISFQAATDAEAVERALAEATAWFAGQPA